MYVESSASLTTNGSLRHASSMDKLNLLAASSSSSNERVCYSYFSLFTVLSLTNCDVTLSNMLPCGGALPEFLE